MLFCAVLGINEQSFSLHPRPCLAGVELSISIERIGRYSNFGILLNDATGARNQCHRTNTPGETSTVTIGGGGGRPVT